MLGAFKRALQAAGVMALAACEEAPTTVKEYVHNDPWSHAINAAIKGPILVHVVNNPFRIDAADLGQRVTDRFARAINSRKLTYTTDPAAAPKGDVFHLVVAFNPPADALGDKVCRRERLEATRPPQDGGKLEVIGAVCVDGVLWVQVRGQAPDVAAPEGHMWDVLMGQLIREMFGQI